MAKKKGKAQGTAVIHCDCKNAYQDKHYGTGMRVHNVCGDKSQDARCTVCSKEHTNPKHHEEPAEDKKDAKKKKGK